MILNLVAIVVFLLVVVMNVFYRNFFTLSTPLAKGSQSLEVREKQNQILARILVVDILLCSAFPVIGRANELHDRTILIDHLPHLFLYDLRKATDEVVDMSCFFHFFLSFFLISTLYHGILERQAKSFLKRS